MILWLITPASFWAQAGAFVLFRFFDAAKPGPVAWADRLFKPAPGSAIGWAQGFGILFDDLVAAFCTLLVIALWRALVAVRDAVRRSRSATRCVRAAWRLATAESCTGGLIAAACTEVSGSSDWFERGFVTYSNEAKNECLGVPATLIELHGAVSEPVVRAMASGALRASYAQWAVAVTGIAGPGGAVPGKPVGTVWLAWRGPGGDCGRVPPLRRRPRGGARADRARAVPCKACSTAPGGRRHEHPAAGDFDAEPSARDVWAAPAARGAAGRDRLL